MSLGKKASKSMTFIIFIQIIAAFPDKMQSNQANLIGPQTLVSTSS